MKMFAAALFLASFAFGQPAPQFTWQGRVDSLVVLRLHGSRLEVSDGKGNALEQQDFLFRNPLPDSAQTIRVDRREGRGAVTVTQQPSIDNHYTAEIAIEDRQGGASSYRVEAYWDLDRGSYSGLGPKQNWGGKRDRLVWSGRVDGDVIVECRADHCESLVQSGLPVKREQAKFSRPMPADTQVTLDETSGRGDIRILEQPAARNRYAVRVRIHAQAAESGEQEFRLSWPRPREK